MLLFILAISDLIQGIVSWKVEGEDDGVDKFQLYISQIKVIESLIECLFGIIYAYADDNVSEGFLLFILGIDKFFDSIGGVIESKYGDGESLQFFLAASNWSTWVFLIVALANRVPENKDIPLAGLLIFINMMESFLSLTASISLYLRQRGCDLCCCNYLMSCVVCCCFPCWMSFGNLVGCCTVLFTCKCKRFLVFASAWIPLILMSIGGAAMIDRYLYLNPDTWTTEP